jgi:hypothetical protein
MINCLERWLDSSGPDAGDDSRTLGLATTIRRLIEGFCPGLEERTHSILQH